MDCLFCKMLSGEIPYKKVYENEMVFAILDINPEAAGHTLVIPKKHICDIYEMDNNTLNALLDAGKLVGEEIIEKLKKTGFSLTINYGSCQEIKHLHMHIIPNKNKKELSVDEVYDQIKK